MPAGPSRAAPVPRGRAQVKAALVESAAALFAARGPAAVSVRDVAARAGVNHGLVHRHFGSKEALLGAVMDRLAADLAADIDTTDRSTGALLRLLGAERPPIWRVLARALLDGYAPAALQRDFPVVHRLIETAREARGRGELDPRLDPRTTAVALAALALGWMLFEPFLVTAAGLDGAGAGEARARLTRWLEELRRRMGPTRPGRRARPAHAARRARGGPKTTRRRQARGARRPTGRGHRPAP